MKVTVCEISNSPQGLARDWAQLVAHVRAEKSDLVLLPEMAFYPWFALKQEFDSGVWQAAVNAHDEWERRFPELQPAAVLGSRPVNRENKRLNEGFLWEAGSGYSKVYTKYYLPDEEGFWEASWYDRGDGVFIPIERGEILIALAICTDIWFLENSRTYGKMGVQIIGCPRATPKSTLDKWLVAGRAAAVVSGAYCLSSNRVSRDERGEDFGGQGWIVGPEGEVLTLTSAEHPILTLDIDLGKADLAKKTYPRYIQD